MASTDGSVVPAREQFTTGFIGRTFHYSVAILGRLRLHAMPSTELD